MGDALIKRSRSSWIRHCKIVMVLPAIFYIETCHSLRHFHTQSFINDVGKINLNNHVFRFVKIWSTEFKKPDAARIVLNEVFQFVSYSFETIYRPYISLHDWNDGLICYVMLCLPYSFYFFKQATKLISTLPKHYTTVMKNWLVA